MERSTLAFVVTVIDTYKLVLYTHRCFYELRLPVRDVWIAVGYVRRERGDLSLIVRAPRQSC